VKLAVVVQRYGLDINGGAELHARYVAEQLARRADVHVLTTCARDYITWRNDLAAGESDVNGVRVRRFPVRRERDPERFGRRSHHVFGSAHSMADELAWLESEGPASTALIDSIRRNEPGYDFFIFFSFRYYHAYHGIRAAAPRALLVPTAERDGAVGLSIFGPIFRGVRAVMYNSFEERAMIHAVSGNDAVPHVVVGVGSEVPARTDPQRFRRKYGITSPFVVYVGRIDENKGCKELFSHFERYARAVPGDLSLVLMGNSILPIPEHPRIRHLGFVEDEDKFDGIAAAEALIMPSYFESLSMVALEAWALGKPVLANGRCDVLQGQCLRSNAGLFYESFEEFLETLALIQSHRRLAFEMGQNGREYFQRHYAWPVIVRKYMEMFERLRDEDAKGAARPPIEPLPGWFARRRADCRAGNEVVQGLPAGPARRPGARR
jgi:glycosyltransferase involved in cell wall biosynthesis